MVSHPVGGLPTASSSTPAAVQYQARRARRRRHAYRSGAKRHPATKFSWPHVSISGGAQPLPRRPDSAMQAFDEAILATEQAIAEGRDAIRDLRPEPTQLVFCCMLGELGSDIRRYSLSSGR